MTVGSQQLRYWIDMTLECVRRDHTNSLVAAPGDQRGPFRTARAVGMALGALHDAYAFANGTPPLLAIPASAGLPGANAIVAAAAACHELLLLRFPKQARMLTPAWVHWRELHAGAGGAEAPGRAFGSAVHAYGVADAGYAAVTSYVADPMANYRHIAPPNEPDQGYAGFEWGKVTRLLASHVAAFPKPPGRIDALTVNPTAHFKSDFDKVKTKGIDQRGGGDRTADEEIMGIFWGYDGPQELGTPPRLYLQVVLQILDNIEVKMPGKLNVAEELGIIAGVGIALADAGVDAWFYKYSDDHMMWRPVVGIRKAVAGNGVAIPGWLPLGRPDTNSAGQTLTPDFPAYPSGHATFGAAAFHLLRLFLVQKGIANFKADGTDDANFEFVSDEYNGRNYDPRTLAPREHIVRKYDSLWQAIVENSVSRVYLGVHWQFDGITKQGADPDGNYGVPNAPKDLGKIGGVWLGGQIANQIALKLGVTAATINKSKMT